jgi:hypothetical protein
MAAIIFNKIDKRINKTGGNTKGFRVHKSTCFVQKSNKLDQFSIAFSLTQNLYLSIDFLRALILTPEVVGGTGILKISEMVSSSVEFEMPLSLPQVDTILTRLPRANVIASLDLKDVFWQIPLDQELSSIMESTIPGKPLYQFIVMSFGLCSSLLTMFRLMDRVSHYIYPLDA